MKKIIKFIKNNILGFLVGLSLCLNGVVIAENIITANQVTYKDSTVQTELDSLFDAVDINERLGNTDEISDIGDGTVSGAISTLDNNLQNINDTRERIALVTGIAQNATVDVTLEDEFTNYKKLIFYSRLSGIATNEEVNVDFFEALMNNTSNYRYPVWINSEKNGGIQIFPKSTTTLTVTNMVSDSNGITGFYVYGVK